MTWKYCDNKGEPNKYDFISKTWWIPDINKIVVQIKSDTIQQLNSTWRLAFDNNKPLTFLIVSNTRGIWRQIQSVHGIEFYTSVYGDNIFTKYDPNKINKLQTNSVGTYYTWNPIPDKLKEFILNTKLQEPNSYKEQLNLNGKKAVE